MKNGTPEIILWLESMDVSLKNTRARLQSWCSCLERAILENEKRHREEKDQLENYLKEEEDVSNNAESVDLNEVEKLLAKARIARVNVGKTSGKDDKKKVKAKSCDIAASGTTVASRVSSLKNDTRYTKVKASHPQKQPTESTKKSSSATSRKTALSSASAIPPETKTAKSAKQKEQTIIKGLLPRPKSGTASATTETCVPQDEEKPKIPCSLRSPVNPELASLCNKISELKKKMHQAKSNGYEEASICKAGFVREAEGFFQGSNFYDPVDQVGTRSTIQEGSNSCIDFGLRVGNILERKKQSITRQIITSLNEESTSDVFKDVDEVISLLLDYENLKIEKKLTELIKDWSRDIFQSPDLSKSEKLMAYRKLYGMVFENGDRLPTMIVDVDGSDSDVEADDDI